MARTINFVRERRRQLKYLAKRDDIILQRISIVFGVVVLICITSLVANFWSAKALDKVIEQQENTRSAITSQSYKELEYNIFVEKLKVLNRLFRQRQGKKEALSFFRSLFDSDEVKISGLEFDDADQKLTFSIQSNSVFSLDQVINVLKSEEVTAKYPRIDKKGVRRDAAGAYTVQMLVNLEELFNDAAEGNKK